MNGDDPSGLASAPKVDPSGGTGDKLTQYYNDPRWGLMNSANPGTIGGFTRNGGLVTIEGKYFQDAGSRQLPGGTLGGFLLAMGGTGAMGGGEGGQVFIGQISINGPAKSNSLQYSDLVKNYPTHADYPTASKPLNKTSIWDLVGGEVGDLGNSGDPDYENSCAIRMSYTLNKSGLSVPKNGRTMSGADGTRYYLAVSSLSTFLKKSLGSPERFSRDTYASKIAGRTGIIAYHFPGQRSTGHFTIWDGQGSIDGRDYGGESNSIEFWPIE